MGLASNLRGVDGVPAGGVYAVDRPAIQVDFEKSPVPTIRSQVPKVLENIRPKVTAHFKNRV